MQNRNMDLEQTVEFDKAMKRTATKYINNEVNVPGIKGKPINIILRESWIKQKNNIILNSRAKGLTDKTTAEVLNMTTIK